MQGLQRLETIIFHVIFYFDHALPSSYSLNFVLILSQTSYSSLVTINQQVVLIIYSIGDLSEEIPAPLNAQRKRKHT